MQSLQCASLLVLAVLASGVSAIPRAPARYARAYPDPRPQGRNLLVDAQIGNVLRSAPGGAQLIKTVPVIPSLINRLPDNATLIRPNLVDNFRCDESKVYGYYADPDNDCQIFHVCLPLKQLYPGNFTYPITYQFSFICPAETIFSQDAMVCAWESEAFPCADAPALYWMNRNFGRLVPDESGFGERYAHVNEPL